MRGPALTEFPQKHNTGNLRSHDPTITTYVHTQRPHRRGATGEIVALDPTVTSTLAPTKLSLVHGIMELLPLVELINNSEHNIHEHSCKYLSK